MILPDNWNMNVGNKKKLIVTWELNGLGGTEKSIWVGAIGNEKTGWDEVAKCVREHVRKYVLKENVSAR